MQRSSTNHDADTIASAQILALRALAWTLAAPDRAHRLLDVTGLTPNDLKSGASERATQAAVLGFLEGYEPDLIACATDLDERPEVLVAARRRLDGEGA
ncbi:DUF3572 domain-containing protein [Sphingomonas sp. S-NIH.Pt15_0812]|jgi:hypothetical protein|uniref:DUF3572 domain-containing protein n=1 Tax=Sphingomonas sp. S-NIH.Pt15_0812 TaxID=1920129 RepID=UPI000F7D851F|nr:DUF3572 domain-containing protein [Sphingomonas sp. S-NIH.Pt15_0812]RSU53124.1 DUF3572 domain-containing protein [Sphingomonas sp. S-NIH.Pt15_0812]